MQFRQALFDAKEHARKEHPREIVGVVINDIYIACKNVSPTPTKNFIIKRRQLAAIYETGETIQEIHHSHTDGTASWSYEDILYLMSFGCPVYLHVFDKSGEFISTRKMLRRDDGRVVNAKKDHFRRGFRS